MSIRSFAAGAAILVAQALPLHAATIDFSVLPTGAQNALDPVTGIASVSLPNADIVSFGSDIFIFDSSIDGTEGLGAFGGFCPTLGGTCVTSAAVGFTLGTVSDLGFDVFGFDEGDAVTAFVFDASASVVPLAGRVVTGAGPVSFSGVSGIASLLLIDGGSTGGGAFFGNFTFEQDVDVAPIPLPAGLPLLLAGLGALGFARRRG